jgi:hypothetical protein
MRKCKSFNLVLGAVVLAVSDLAMADTITITLGGGATSAVPLSSTLTALIAATVAFAGYVVLKNKKARGLWLALVSFGIAGAVFWFQNSAEAVGPPDLTNTQLSATFNSCFDTEFTFQNQSASSVTITGITDDGNPHHSTINFFGSTCQLNTAVNASATCTIAITAGPC